MSQSSAQVLILGGGPGGYSCALRAAQLGLDVLLVESDQPGGTCLHAGCIPSKAIIHAAQLYREVRGAGQLATLGISAGAAALDWQQTQSWKTSVVNRLASGVTGLLSRAGVRVLQGTGEMRDGKRARVIEPSGEEHEIVAEHVVLALGASEVELPGLGSSERVMYARDALQLSELPASLAVIGGGYIGLELGQAFARLGVAVSVVEAQQRLLPAYPAALTQPVVKALQADGVEVYTGATAQGYVDARRELNILAGQDAGETALPAEAVLVAVGRKPRLTGWGCENLALEQADGHIVVDGRCQTSMTDVYAVGDLTGEPMLAHRAMAQGQVVAERIAGRRRQFAPIAIPAVCFTSPEIVSVGLTAEAARDQGHSVLVQRYPLAANGRALTLGDGVGFVEVVAEADSKVLLGVQAVGEHVAELAHSFTLALEMGALLQDVADTIFAHPTLGETFAEASAAALGLPLHS